MFLLQMDAPSHAPSPTSSPALFPASRPPPLDDCLKLRLPTVSTVWPRCHDIGGVFVCVCTRGMPFPPCFPWPRVVLRYVVLCCVVKRCVLVHSRGGMASVAFLAHVAVRIQDPLHACARGIIMVIVISLVLGTIVWRILKVIVANGPIRSCVPMCCASIVCSGLLLAR